MLDLGKGTRKEEKGQEKSRREGEEKGRQVEI